MYIRRKVYSIAEDDYGYENLYSVNDTYMDEDLYSVTMTEDEARLFSDFCEYLYSNGDVESGRDIGQLAGGALGAGAAGYGAHRWLTSKSTGTDAQKRIMDSYNKRISDIKKTDIIDVNQSKALKKKYGNDKEAYDKALKEIKDANKKKYEDAVKVIKDEMKADGRLKGVGRSRLERLANDVQGNTKGGLRQKMAKVLRNKKTAYGLAGATALAGMGAGAALGRPLGGAVNRGRE